MGRLCALWHSGNHTTMKLFSLSFAVSMPLCATHTAMNKPPTWHDHTGYWIFQAGRCAAGCKGEKATMPAEGCVCEVYSNYTFIPGEPTIPPMSPLKTYQDACQSRGVGGVDSCCQDFCQDPANQLKGQPCEGCDWTRLIPWRAPGTAPVFSPCGFDGGNPEGCPVGNPSKEGCMAEVMAMVQMPEASLETLTLRCGPQAVCRRSRLGFRQTMVGDTSTASAQSQQTPWISPRNASSRCRCASSETHNGFRMVATIAHCL